MNNFDLRKFLTENKLTKVSKLTETILNEGQKSDSISFPLDISDTPRTPRTSLNESDGAPGTLTFKYDGFDPTGDKDYEAGEVGGSLMYYSDDFPDEGTLFLEIGADASLDSSEIFRLYPDQVKVYFKNVSMNEQADELDSNSNFKFTIDDGEDVSELNLQDYPDLDTALYDVVQDLASTYNGSVSNYLNNVKEKSKYGSFKNLQHLLDYEVDKAGGLEGVLQNGLHLVMPGTTLEDVFIKVKSI